MLYACLLYVKITETTNGSLTFGICNNINWLDTVYNVNVDFSTVEVNTWTKVSTQFVVNENNMGEFANLDLSFITENASENNYVLIDNFKIIDSFNNEYEKISYNNIVNSIVVIIVSLAIVIIFAMNLKRISKNNDADEDDSDETDE